MWNGLEILEASFDQANPLSEYPGVFGATGRELVLLSTRRRQAYAQITRHNVNNEAPGYNRLATPTAAPVELTFYAVNRALHRRSARLESVDWSDFLFPFRRFSMPPLLVHGQ